MTQTLNLYDAAWLARPETSLPWPPLAVLGGALLLAVGVAWWNGAQQQLLQERLAATTSERSRLQAQAGPGGDRQAALAALSTAAQQRELTLQQWRGIGASPGGGQGGAGAAASQWFISLAKVSHEGTWLTRVQSDVAGGFRLEGRAQDGAALSAYLERWRDEPLLTGVALQTLEMRRAAGEPGAPAAPLANANPNELVFVLSNLLPGATPGAGAGSNDPLAPRLTGPPAATAGAAPRAAGTSPHPGAAL